jgi:lipopolysaccharide export system protein LptA
MDWYFGQAYRPVGQKADQIMNRSNRHFVKILHNVSLGIGSCLILTTPVLAQTASTNSATAPPPITIEANDSLEWNQTNGTYIAKGNAYVEQGQANISASHIIANYTTEGETRDITQVTATGSVTYIEGENTAKGQKLDYDLINNLYVLTGKNASVTGPKGTMTATKSITYDSADNNNRKVIAIGKAHYENSDGRNVFGDRLIAYIGADGTLKTIDAYDNTKVITAQGTVATADELSYIASKSVANLDGNVEIIDKENIMRGARAKIDFDKEISTIISGPTGKRVTGILTP